MARSRLMSSFPVELSSRRLEVHSHNLSARSFPSQAMIDIQSLVYPANKLLEAFTSSYRTH